MSEHDKTLLKRTGVVVAGLLIILFAWLIFYANFIFHVTGITPNDGDISQYTPVLNVSFSHDIDSKKIVTTMQPDAIGSAIVKNKALTINFDILEVGQKYTVTVKNISSTSGKKLPDQTITFTAKDIPFDKLPASQQEAAMQQQNSPGAANTQDKAYNYIPYGDLNYNLSIDDNNGVIVITAELLLSAADVRSDRNAAIEQYKREVLDYMKKSGLDPTKYQITYTVTESS